ncbi:hypothetical protein RhiJN_24729 [Ceratobasidium sp. AG-Ba]|nr:hypothetical protein RhiJN_24729 [Ceratobasidium sp. AG-Ba]
MSESNFTIKDISPLIKYQGQWTEVLDSNMDSSLSSYRNSSFHTTQDGTAQVYSDYYRILMIRVSDSSGQASWTFRGTSLYVYGARRSTHGHYSVGLDDAPPEEFDGAPQSGQDQFQYPLFVKTGLPNTVHNVTITNVPFGGRSGLDLDYITWTIEKNSTYRELYIDDTEFDYADPYPVWFNRTHSDGFYRLTFHSTFKNTSASFKFNGSDVYIYGGTGQTPGTNRKYQGITRVYIDGHDYVSRFNKSTSSAVQVQCIFYMGDLGNGTHTVVVANDDDAGTNLDYAIVAGWGDNVPVTPGSSQPESRRIGGGAIAGIVIGCILGVGLLLAVVLWISRRRKRIEKGRFSPDLIPPSRGSLNGVEPYQSSSALDSMTQTRIVPVTVNPPRRKGMPPRVDSSTNRASTTLVNEYSEARSSVDQSELPPSYDERLRDRLTAARS